MEGMEGDGVNTGLPSASGKWATLMGGFGACVLRSLDTAMPRNLPPDITTITTTTATTTTTPTTVTTVPTAVVASHECYMKEGKQCSVNGIKKKNEN